MIFRDCHDRGLTQRSVRLQRHTCTLEDGFPKASGEKKKAWGRLEAFALRLAGAEPAVLSPLHMPVKINTSPGPNH